MIRASFAFIAAWLALGAPAAQADYYARWDRVGGGWTTGWVGPVQGNANTCGHFHHGCRCGNVCGNYPNGAVTRWWPHGCQGQMWQIRCTIRPIVDTGAAECRNYATNATHQHNENTRRRCGYTGGRWHANYQAHYNWCVAVSPGLRASEDQARRAGLAQCGAGHPIGSIAIQYAIYGQNCPHSNQDPRYPGQKNVTAHVARACNARAQCTYQVNHQVIGDPAYGCRKDFRIQYRCGNATKQAFVHPEASGRSAQLVCP